MSKIKIGTKNNNNIILRLETKPNRSVLVRVNTY